MCILRKSCLPVTFRFGARGCATMADLKTRDRVRRHLSKGRRSCNFRSLVSLFLRNAQMLANINEAIEGWATRLDQALGSSPPRTPPSTPSSAPISVRGSPNYVTALADSPPRSGSSSAEPSPRTSPSVAHKADPLYSPDELRFRQYLHSNKITEMRAGCPHTRKIALRGQLRH